MPFIPVIDHSDAVSRAIVDHRFGPSGCPALDEDQVKRIQSLRENGRLLARHIIAAAPNSWERDEALKAVDDACSWSARAISRNE